MKRRTNMSSCELWDIIDACYHANYIEFAQRLGITKQYLHIVLCKQNHVPVKLIHKVVKLHPDVSLRKLLGIKK